MTSLGVILILVYAALLLIGGFVGFRVSGSRVSLISGVASAAVLVVAWLLARSTPARGLWLAAAVALALTVVFIMRFFKTGSFMPAGMMVVLSVAALVLFVLAARG